MRPRSITLLHGFLGLPSSMSRAAHALRSALGLPVRAVLLPGHGEAPWGLEHSSFDEVVEAAEARWFPRGGDGHILIGYSLGGRLALGLGARLPGLARVVAVGAHVGLTSEGERRERAAQDDARARMVEAGGLEAFTIAWAKEPIFASQRRLAASLLAEQEGARRSHTTRGVAWALRVLSTGRMPDLRPRLAKDERVDLVAGALDAKFVEHHRAARAALPRARTWTVPACGHNVLLEDPLGSVALFTRLLASADDRPAAHAASPRTSS